MKILIDMNLSPDWVEVFARHGHTAVHWSTVGDPRAEDTVLMDLGASECLRCVHAYLDFGAALALTQAESPSVIQVRTQDVTPAHLAAAVVEVLEAHKLLLEAGALIVLDEGRSRVRILPLARRS